MAPTKLHEETRVTDTGVSVKCVYVDPIDVQFVDIALLDAMNRQMLLSVRRSTVLVLVPTGTFGTMILDPSGEFQNNRWLFRQRNILTPNDVAGMIRASAEQPTLVTAGAVPFRRPS